MKLLKALCIPLTLALAGAESASAGPLLNADISAGACEQNCGEFVLLGDDLFFVWKGEERPNVVLRYGPKDGENAMKLAATPVRGELNTQDCVASCEVDVLVANLKLTVRRDGDGEIEAICARPLADIHFQGAKTRRGLPPALPGSAKRPGQAQSAAQCASNGARPGNGECRETEVWDEYACHCIKGEVVLIGSWLTVGQAGNVLGVRTGKYNMPKDARPCCPM